MKGATPLGLTRRTIIAGGTALAASGAVPAFGAAGGYSLVETRTGKLRGRSVGNVTEFRGVRYAEPQTARNRFNRAIPLKPWSGVRNALMDGAQAMQFPSDARVWAAEFRDFNPMSEDCLFLNVYAPAGPGKPRPVMFWCHGGGFATGSGTVPIYDGRNLAEYGDVVVVTVNHRLSSLGFLDLADLGGSGYSASANAGMLDIVDALRWVRDNIAAFGGDPANVTIFGESGGGAKVSILLAMPEAAGLFHKAIVQSGSALRQRPREQATASARKLLASLDLAPDQCARLREIPVQDYVTAAADMRFEFAPVVDGLHLPTHAFDPAAPEISRQIPIMIGTNQTEASIFGAEELFSLDEAGLRRTLARAGPADMSQLIDHYIASYPRMTPSQLYFRIATDIGMRASAVRQAELKVAQKAAPAFMYLLSWQAPGYGGRFQSPHALDLPFVFRNQRMLTVRKLIGLGQEQDRLADRMSAAWVAFARTGDPSNSVTGTWNAYDTSRRATMIFDDKASLVDDPDAADRQYFMQK